MTLTVAPGTDLLVHALRGAWGRDTSVDPGWSEDLPALGQCAVTALVIQDYLGGRLLRADVEGISHYWNLIDGQVVDLTREQFTAFHPSRIESRDREYVLSYPDTQRRYSILKRRVDELLARQAEVDE